MFRARALLYSALFLAGALPDLAGRSATFAWDLNPDPSIAGYIVRYGVESGNYTNSTVFIGQISTVIIHNLPPFDSLYFACYCFDTNGLESPPSQEVALCKSSLAVSTIRDQTTPQDTVTPPIPFTIGASNGLVANLQLFGISSNPALLPDENITFDGAGLSRTVSLRPAPGQSGSAVVSIVVTDGCATTNTAFQLTVGDGIGTPAPELYVVFLGPELGVWWFDYGSAYRVQRTQDPSRTNSWETIQDFPASIIHDKIRLFLDTPPTKRVFYRVVASP